MPRPSCQGTTRKGTTCGITNLVPGRNYCHWHALCHGLCRNGNPCRSRATAEFDWKYCRADHDPRRIRTTDPAIFRLDGLRIDRSGVVKEFRGGSDVFTGETLHEFGRNELDHVVELHVVRDNFDRLKRVGDGFGEQKTLLKEDLKRIVNERENLNFTTPAFNCVKFEGFKNFQAVYHQRESTVSNELDLGIVHFLRTAKARRTEKQLSRTESRNIQKAVYEATEKIVDELQQNDNIVAVQMVDLLQDNFVSMK